MSQPTRVCPTCHTPLPGMAAFCYVCGTATPSGIDRATGVRVAMGGNSGITTDDLLKRLQRALGPGYQLEDRIGAGGFAVVYHARDLRLKRDLAIKVLRPDLGLSADILQRFRREAETIAALRSSHIVPVYDVGEAESLAFLIMPLIKGESLRSAMDREGAMPVAEVQRILTEAAEGLAAAHDAGMIHRDVKPENIMLDGKERRVLLMDFGIAKIVSKDDADPGEALTTTGIIIGTPQYMSPEQATGDKRIDARTDQYSLGVVGYRMLTGRLPFEGESTRAVLYQQLVAEPAPLETHLPGIPSAMAATIQKAMAKEPSDRFPSMREFAEAMRTNPVAAAPVGKDKKAQPKAAAKAAAAPKVARAGKAGGSPAIGELLKQRPVQIGGGLGVLFVALILWFVLRQSGPPVTPVAGNPDSTVIANAATTPVVAPPIIPEPPPPVTTAPPPATNKPARGAAATTVGQKPNPQRGANGAATTQTTATTGAGAPTTPPPPPATANCMKLVGAADWAKAVTTCTAEAEGGNAVSQRLLAGMYAKGTGITADPAQAVNWYRKASATDPESKFRLAEMLDAGKGVKQNSSESIALLREAAALSYLPAQELLAKRLENGTNVKKDEAEAGLWYRRMAEKGDKLAQTKLAEFLAKGKGITKNEAEALDWYKKAGGAGFAEASWGAAQMYFKGQGTVKNETEGMFWLRKAAEGGNADAVKELKKRGG